jgi:hypothetical protein
VQAASHLVSFSLVVEGEEGGFFANAPAAHATGGRRALL